jgi:uncharacterized membrane protein
MAFCPNCGSSVDGRFCQTCGAAVAAGPVGGGAVPPPPPAPVPQPQMSAPGMTDNAAGALCYLFGLITGILFLVLAPYNQSRSVKFNAFQSIFFNIAWIAIWIAFTIVAIALHAIPVLGAILSLFLNFVLLIGGLIAWFYLMYKTYNGEKVVLPIIGPLAEKQAGV